MVQGVVLIKWDVNKGPVIEGKYPEWINISDKAALAIFNAHTIGGKYVKRSILSIDLSKFVSYYTGYETNKCMAVVLEKNENANIYFEHIIDIISKYQDDSVGLKYQDLSKIYKKFEKLSKVQDAVDKIIKFF
ncbi:MAG: hypothetical protein ACTSQY_07770 [Candidatus Odinarchaeia archaeon]